MKREPPQTSMVHFVELVSEHAVTAKFLKWQGVWLMDHDHDQTDDGHLICILSMEGRVKGRVLVYFIDITMREAGIPYRT